ncbi:hypothetical protein D918_09579 [Trichuris suis]|nr:hypothetical protein D918_09579 [Trichuris suis]
MSQRRYTLDDVETRAWPFRGVRTFPVTLNTLALISSLRILVRLYLPPRSVASSEDIKLDSDWSVQLVWSWVADRMVLAANRLAARCRRADRIARQSSFNWSSAFVYDLLYGSTETHSCDNFIAGGAISMPSYNNAFAVVYSRTTAACYAVDALRAPLASDDDSVGDFLLDND